MNPDPKLRTVYWCSPAYLSDETKLWILFRERIRDVGNTGWTTRAADKDRTGPERVAYRLTGERFWKSWDGRFSPFVVDHGRREDIPEEEAVAILLMAKNNPGSRR